MSSIDAQIETGCWGASDHAPRGKRSLLLLLARVSEAEVPRPTSVLVSRSIRKL
jgi:hypothetical protein